MRCKILAQNGSSDPHVLVWMHVSISASFLFITRTAIYCLKTSLHNQENMAEVKLGRFKDSIIKDCDTMFSLSPFSPLPSPRLFFRKDHGKEPKPPAKELLLQPLSSPVAAVTVTLAAAWRWSRPPKPPSIPDPQKLCDTTFTMLSL